MFSFEAHWRKMDKWKTCGQNETRRPLSMQLYFSLPCCYREYAGDVGMTFAFQAYEPDGWRLFISSMSKAFGRIPLIF